MLLNHSWPILHKLYYISDTFIYYPNLVDSISDIKPTRNSGLAPLSPKASHQGRD